MAKCHRLKAQLSSKLWIKDVLERNNNSGRTLVDIREDVR